MFTNDSKFPIYILRKDTRNWFISHEKLDGYEFYEVKEYVDEFGIYFQYERGIDTVFHKYRLEELKGIAANWPWAAIICGYIKG